MTQLFRGQAAYESISISGISVSVYYNQVASSSLHVLLPGQDIVSAVGCCADATQVATRWCKAAWAF